MVLRGSVEASALGNFNQILIVSGAVNFSQRGAKLQRFILQGVSSRYGVWMFAALLVDRFCDCLPGRPDAQAPAGAPR
ncbi:MAG: hypothetical protein ABSF53_03245 [Terracidiphilus sp.]|jgi:hypothetical protein